MSKPKAKASSEFSAQTLAEEIKATRMVWENGVVPIRGTWNVLAAELRQLAIDMFNSPLGKRAQRHPATALTIASVAVPILFRLVRR